MKKLFYLACFLPGFVTIAEAQQKKEQPPVVNLKNVNPPVANKKSAKKPAKSQKKNIPKVDISNFKAPKKH